MGKIVIERMILLLAHFPTLYPDELLYSAISRYHLSSGNKAQKQTINDLFHDKLVCATVDLPSHIKQLSDQINNVYTIDYLIRNHTLFSYYESFLIQEKAEKIFSLMSKGSAWGEVHSTLGLTASIIKSPKYLKFCKVCYKEDESSYNEPYWHCAHQIPGVYICPLHNEDLTNTKVFCHSRDHKFEFVPLVHIGQRLLPKEEIPASWREHLIIIAEFSTKLMNLKNEHLDTSQYYKAKLYTRGYVTPSGSLRFTQFSNDFLEFFPNDLLLFLDCKINHKMKETWIHKILRGKERIFHPLRHILVHIFLDLDIRGKKNNTVAPFGYGPWPCLNKATMHFRENVIDQCTVTRGSKSGKPVGTFNCTCGFTYSRTGPDKSSDDRTRIGRIKSFGHIWFERLCQLNQQSLSSRAKAKLLGVDPGTVKLQTDKLTNNQPMEHNQDFQKEIAIRRGRFLRSLEEAKEKSIPNRQVNKKDYAWLYRSDRIWLFQVTSENKIDYVKHTRIDWKKRDEEILIEIRKVMLQIGNIIKPRRITIAEIVRNMNDNTGRHVLHSLQKLPRTKEFLEKRVETTKQFQIRRLKWAAEELKNDEYIFKGWQLLKRAGLNNSLDGEVRDAFVSLMDDYDIHKKGGNQF